MFGPSDEDSDETPAQSSATARTSILGVFNASAAVHELTLMQNIEIADMDDDVEDDMDDDGEDSVDKQSADDVQDEDDAGDETANGVAYVALDSDVEDGDSTETEFYVDDGVTTEALGDSETESDEEFANMDDELYAQSQDRDAVRNMKQTGWNYARATKMQAAQKKRKRKDPAQPESPTGVHDVYQPADVA
ncbi:hypothetical protein JG687_00006511 [Phytophthora cactorum]|uniref:Uncharacterized protein n=2 Tax=Phytophthora cactorum TaxID=29920 RepID=A0A329SB13_9STRA|nr:hypothetical protein Pcac1_g5610 [Phytophthora cactorum]KAG2918549.1 hypothetical protein PC114_g6789 [Phytophthora cactorum]KAG4235515.1 hypothetical protein PC116_g16349 [Phytophthora cactorum]KAG6963534.1 hypothetical protein JG687_00006511 [Phytophthora cactorum]RAW34067.1 hypothetical protein PC110_g9617 [Phytophthora cactorum]